MKSKQSTPKIPQKTWFRAVSSYMSHQQLRQCTRNHMASANRLSRSREITSGPSTLQITDSVKVSIMSSIKSESVYNLTQHCNFGLLLEAYRRQTLFKRTWRTSETSTMTIYRRSKTSDRLSTYTTRTRSSERILKSRTSGMSLSV